MRIILQQTPFLPIFLIPLITSHFQDAWQKNGNDSSEKIDLSPPKGGIIRHVQRVPATNISTRLGWRDSASQNNHNISY